ncbi:MAG TPA: rhomboid family intramembrane serine protease [Candidatus Acidoferrales bacterium]|nr:rhomboid family intramembrane serine protease [Candidatus Acidoferrales bacterium]
MIPLKDLNPRSTRPFVTVLIILTNVAVFLYELSLGPRVGRAFLFEYGMIPARVGLLLSGHAASLTQTFAPLLTSMFLHGSFLHIIGNMWFLWIFGDNIEDFLGHWDYLLFYLVCGIGAGVVHTLANLGSTVPAVGASGAISGVLGAYIVLFPRSRVLTLVPLIFFFFTVQLPAVVILGYWFLIQFLSGLSALGEQTGGGTAWWAHIGGFILGALLVMGSRRR